MENNGIYFDLAEYKDKYLYFFANCFPVRGHTRTMICDIQRRRLFFVDNSYYELINALNENTIGEVIDMLEGEDDYGEFDKFVRFLLKNDLGEFVDDLSLFPRIQPDWDHPSPITNAIIDIRDKPHDFQKIFNELDDLNCYYIQIRSFGKTDLAALTDIFAQTKGKCFRGIQVLIRYEKGVTEIRRLKQFTHQFPIALLSIYATPETYLKKIKSDNFYQNVCFISQEISSCEACGVINLQSLYIPSLKGFLENMNFNGCLNRKISIDESGQVKNCPSMQRGFGDIMETSLRDVIKHEEFTRLWHITKDQIDICKDCEFRRICTDCRAYVEEKNNIYSKPAKCSYNPYTGKWADQAILSGNHF